MLVVHVTVKTLVVRYGVDIGLHVYLFIQGTVNALLVTQNAEVQHQFDSVSEMTGCVTVIMIVEITGTKTRHTVVSVLIIDLTYLVINCYCQPVI